MKKFLVFLFSLSVLLLICVYIFIPGKLNISKIEYINCNINGVARVLGDQSTWAKWWPQKDSMKARFMKDSFFYNKYSYHLSNKFYNNFEVLIKNNKVDINSRINIIKINRDSVALIWKCLLPGSMNPIKRVLKYRQAENIRNNMTDILSGLRLFLEKNENIYGVNFHITMSNDTTMVAIKSVSPNYPSTPAIYNLIESLKNYIAIEGARENNFPMLNVRQLSDSTFETMVAIPVNKQLPGRGKIFFSRFVPWKVLTGEVKGGSYTVNTALHQMETYISDYEKTAMAIPFQLLVTNRIEEPDTLKWITRIYTPVP